MDNDVLETTRRLDAVASLETAARLWGARTLEQPSVQAMTVRRYRSRAPKAGVELLRADLSPREIRTRSGVRVTSPARTAVDLARVRGVEASVVFLDSALQLKLIRPGQVAAATKGVRGPGAPRVRAACAAADGRSQSAPETLLRLWLRADPRVGSVVPQMRLRAGGHPYDLGLPELRSVAEFQSWQWHNERKVWVRDARWGNEAYARNFGYAQVVYEDIVAGRDHVVDLVLGRS